jgi:meiotically up-regulated gene 157 (Mug157) protein
MNTRNFILSDSDPYFMRGPGLSAVGGPHLGPGKGWPMAAIVRALTAFSLGEGRVPQMTKQEIEDEVKQQIQMVLDSTDGTGVVHESVNAWNEKDWTRVWFGWANGLMGELILKVEKENVGILEGRWQ